MKELFNPKTVALIGATDRPGSVGLGIAKNLLLGQSASLRKPASNAFGVANAGRPAGETLLAGKTKRKIFFINPSKKKILGQKAFASILDIKEKTDLAIIAVPAKFVQQVSQECCQAKVGSCIIISSGFAEAGKDGVILQKEIKELFAKNNIPLVGPNCLGIINPLAKLNASFAPETPKQGSIAFLSQSGALIDSIIDKSLLENFGFSLMVSYGNEAGMLLSDFLKIASQDKASKVIAVYLEEIKNGQEFIKVSKEITKQKPIIVLKGGKTEVGKLAAQSHTASLAGDEKIYSAAFAKAGVIEVETIRDLFLLAQVLSSFALCHSEPAGEESRDPSLIAQGDRVNALGDGEGWPASNASQASSRSDAGWAILTNGGAVGVITADWCSRFGVRLAGVWDILGDANTQKYQESLLSLLKQKEINGVIFCQTLQTMTNPEQNAKIIIQAQKRFPKKPILPLFLGGKITKNGSDFLSKNRLVCFNEPRDIALCAKILSQHDKS